MKWFQSSLYVAVCIVGLCVLSGCEKKKMDDGKIPVTTSSEEAKKEYLEGRDLADKLLLTNSIEHFDKAIALDPNFAAAYLARANVATTAKGFFEDQKNAVAHADKASEGERLLIMANEAGTSGNSAEQRKDLESLVAKYPKDERAHFAMGGFLFGQQDYDGAIEHYKKAMEINPGFSPVYNIMGYAYRQNGNYPEAEKAFKKYTELIPNDPNPYDSYAELLMKMGRFDESIDYYKKALNVDPMFVASHSGIATNYMYKGMLDEGIAELDKLYGMARNDGERRTALFVKSVLYADNGKMDLAVQEADKEFAVAEKINDAASMSADLVLKGNILREMGKYDDAKAAFEKSIELSDKSDVSQSVKDNVRLFHHYNMATVAIAKKDIANAKTEAEEFRKGAESSKNQNQIRTAHELMGSIALAEKKYDDAITELNQSNQQNPRNLFMIAQAYQAKGDKANAKEFYGKAAHFNGLPGINAAFVRMKAEKMAKM